MSEKLTQIRAEIDALDATLCDLLGARRGLIAQVAATKPDKNMMLMRPAREAQQMRKLAAVAKEKKSTPARAGCDLARTYRHGIDARRGAGNHRRPAERSSGAGAFRRDVGSRRE